MQVYKAYFKIVKKRLPVISIYLCVFLMISILMPYFHGKSADSAYSPSRIHIALVNDDGPSVVSEGLSTYLHDNAKVIDVDREDLQDALFYHQVEYILRIPRGFSQGCLSGTGNVQLEKTSVPDTMSTFYLDFLVNRYLDTINLYKKNVPGISDVQLLSLVENDMSRQSKIQIQSYGKKSSTDMADYYTYLAYALIAVVFLGITSIMMAFNDEDIRRRNLGSPLKSFSMNLQIMLGNLSFALIVWVIVVLLGIIITGPRTLDVSSMMIYANSICFVLACLCLSFLAGNFINNNRMQAAAANVISLGLCFIGGVFVPQHLLSKTILFMGSFTPTYWYIKAVNDIDRLLVYSAANLSPIFYSMLIQLGLALALLCVGLAISRQKKVRI